MEIQLLESAEGPCVNCGVESKGSPYWLGMTLENWLVLRPFVGQLNVNEWSFKEKYPPEDRAMNLFFVPGVCKPLCSAQCATEISNGD